MTDRDMFGDFAGPAALPTTPLPWRVDSDGRDMAVIGADGAMVACNAPHMPTPGGAEDMALIVLAVNAYAPLVAALRALVDALDDNEGSDACRHNISLAVTQAEDAIDDHGGDL